MWWRLIASVSLFCCIQFVNSHKVYGGDFSFTHSLYQSHINNLYTPQNHSIPEVTRFHQMRRDISTSAFTSTSDVDYTPIRNIYTTADSTNLITVFTEAQVLEIEYAIRVLCRYIGTRNSSNRLDIHILKHVTSIPTLLADAHKINTTHNTIRLYIDNIPPTVLFTVMLHELIHILGFGSTPQWYTYITPDDTFVGPLSLRYIAKFGQTNLSLETAHAENMSDLVHWRQTGVLENDIMMATISNPTINAVSFAAIRDADPAWNVYACVDDSDCHSEKCTHVNGFPSSCRHNPYTHISTPKPTYLLSIGALVGSFVYVSILMKCRRRYHAETTPR